jgi:predicted TIM-barrel fold metal-dependent hydrolase
MSDPKSDQHYVVISTDGHAGAQLLEYRPYLESRYYDAFDAWASSYYDPWAEIDANSPVNERMGVASYQASFNWDSAARLACTESQGIAAEVLFPNTVPPFYPSGAITAPGPRSPEEYELRFAGLRAHNRWMADFCKETPGRRAGFVQLFLDDVDAAVAEIRAGKELGLKGVLLPGDHTLKMANLYYSKLDPIWQACEELELPIHRHGNWPTESVEEAGPGATWAAIMEIAFYGNRHIPHLILSGVFERFPGLKLVTTEPITAGAIPSLLAQMDQVYASMVNRMGSNGFFVDTGLQRKPSEYFETNCYVGGALDTRAAYEAGTSNLMFGSDLPHSEGTTPYTVEAVRYMFSDVPATELEQILGLRAAEVYDFDLELLRAVADRIGPTVEEIAVPLVDAEVPRPPQTRSNVFTAAGAPT